MEYIVYYRTLRGDNLAKRLTIEEVFNLGNKINNTLMLKGISYAMTDAGNNTWNITMYNQGINRVIQVFNGSLRECYTYLLGACHLATGGDISNG